MSGSRTKKPDPSQLAWLDVGIPRHVERTATDSTTTAVIPPAGAYRGRPRAAESVLQRLADPPNYTPYPNPDLAQSVTVASSDSDSWDPGVLDGDVSAGKNESIYFAHYYPTKVPPAAILPYILHYSRPGDLVLDGFCGTGMTGVAAQFASDQVHTGRHPRTGTRRCVLVDLSATATFIAAMTNRVGRVADYADTLSRWIDEVETEYAELLCTAHVGWARGSSPTIARSQGVAAGDTPNGKVEYVVWSDVFSCPECGTRLVHWDLIYRGPGQPEPNPLRCTHCDIEVTPRTLERIWCTRFDHVLGRPVRQAEQVPVLINYSVGTKRFEKRPDEHDLRRIERCAELIPRIALPTRELPQGFNTEQPKRSHGFTHVHHFFTDRNLVLLGGFWERVRSESDAGTRRFGLYLLTGALQRVVRLNRYMPRHDRHVGPLSGTLYVSQVTAEIPAVNYLRSRLKDLLAIDRAPVGVTTFISTQSSGDLSNLPDAAVDYIFTDPPFGSNLNYSELNTLVEAWLEVESDTADEAIVHEIQRKTVTEYRILMEASFREFFRVLKPGRYMTVEFHNSENRIWTALQEAIARAGFVIAHVCTLDKQKGTTKQLSYASTVKQDLVITAYKSRTGAATHTDLTTMVESEVWSFVTEHLRRLPSVTVRNGRLVVQAERLPYLLYDRLLTHCIARGILVPVSSPEFYEGLEARFVQREGMLFLSTQVDDYDRARASCDGTEQIDLFVSDERSARAWVRARLEATPSRFQDIQPHFMQAVRAWTKEERPVELLDVLREGFLEYDGSGPLPTALRSLPGVRADGGEMPSLTGTWYVADPGQQAELERLRERALLREFEAQVLSSKGRKLRQVRGECVRAGMKALFQRRDYVRLLEVAGRLPESVLRHDDQIAMYVDAAEMRAGMEES